MKNRCTFCCFMGRTGDDKADFSSVLRTSFLVVRMIKGASASWSRAVLCLAAPLCLTLRDPIDSSPPGPSVHGDSPGMNTGVGCHALSRGSLQPRDQTQDLPHCRQIHYHLNHQGSPRVLEWVAHPFSRGSSWNRTGISCNAGGFFTSWATREALMKQKFLK